MGMRVLPRYTAHSAPQCIQPALAASAGLTDLRLHEVDSSIPDLTCCPLRPFHTLTLLINANHSDMQPAAAAQRVICASTHASHMCRSLDRPFLQRGYCARALARLERQILVHRNPVCAGAEVGLHSLPDFLLRHLVGRQRLVVYLLEVYALALLLAHGHDHGRLRRHLTAEQGAVLSTVECESSTLVQAAWSTISYLQMRWRTRLLRVFARLQSVSSLTVSLMAHFLRSKSKGPVSAIARKRSTPQHA